MLLKLKISLSLVSSFVYECLYRKKHEMYSNYVIQADPGGGGDSLRMPARSHFLNYLYLISTA